MLDNSDPQDLLARVHALQEEIETIWRRVVHESERQWRGLPGEFLRQQRHSNVGSFRPVTR